ncbi:MAG: hypothetical protein ABEJ70_01260 [Halobacteriaceae archaeon]
MARTEAEAFDLMVQRVASSLSETGAAFPYYADPETGAWTTTENGNWCGGHWIHMLWMAYAATDDERFREAAREHTDVMTDYMPETTMFRGLCYNFAGFGGYDVSGDGRERDVGVAGADSMRAYFHEGARQVPVGTLVVEVPEDLIEDFRSEENEVPGSAVSSADDLHTALPPLWRAYHETGDPTYRDYAVSHADRAIDWVVRPSGATWNVVQFDPETGDLVDQFNDLAYSDETCWARGQGWATAGFCRAYAETGARRYLDVLTEMMDYYEANAPADMIPHWDFEHPEKPDVPRDTSCAAISAYGLSLLPETEETAHLRAHGDRIVESLVTDYLTPQGADDDRPVGMTLEGCYDGPAGFADHHELVWTDHYLMAALRARLD